MMRWTLAAWFITSALAFPYNYLFRRDADFYSVRTRLDFSHQDRDREDSAKYFHEASFHNHYDGRFADRQLGYEERKSNLTLLIQTYLATMNDLGAETFIMHGSLLGWWWNRRAMPWDSDLDVMVSERSIQHLARYYNLTIYSHVVPDTDGSRRDYLLEVNPHCANATRDQINKIDARCKFDAREDTLRAGAIRMPVNWCEKCTIRGAARFHCRSEIDHSPKYTDIQQTLIP